MVSPMRPQRQADLYAGATVLLWATAASAFKLALAHLDPVQFLFYSASVSTLALLLILAFSGRLRTVRELRRGDWLLSMTAGLLNPFLYYLVLFQAYARLPAQEAQPLNFVWPIVLTLLSVPLLGRPLGSRELLGLVVCFFGVGVISTHGDVTTLHFRSPLGVALALGSSVVWAAYWLLNVRDRRDETIKLFCGFACSLPPLALLVCLASSPFPIGPEAWKGFPAAVWVGLFEMGITFVLWLRALTLSPSTARVASFIYLVPFLSLVCIRLVLGEVIRPSTMIGLVLIVAGIALGKRDLPSGAAASVGEHGVRDPS